MKKHRKIRKLLGRSALLAIVIGSVYYLIDLRTELFRNADDPARFQTFQSTYTSEPIREAAPRSPDPKWGGKTTGRLFLGFIPTYVLYMAIAIIFVLSSGFLFMLIFTISKHEHRN
jgi:hypothetical protein